MARKKKKWTDFFTQDMEFERGKVVSSAPSSVYTPSTTTGSSSSPVSNSSFTSPRSEPYYTKYASQKVVTNAQKKEVSESFNQAWSKEKKDKEWKRIDQMIKGGEKARLKQSELDFYEGKTDKIEQEPFKEDPNYFLNKNKETIKNTTKMLKDWGENQPKKIGDPVKYSGSMSRKDIEELVGGTIAADGDILEKSGVSTYDEWTNMVKNADNKPQNVAWKVDGEWVVMPMDTAEKVSKEGFNKDRAKFKLQTQGLKAINPMGDDNFKWGFNQSMQVADTLPSATRRLIHSAGTGKDAKQVGKDVLNDIFSSLNGKYATALTKGDTKNGPVYGRDILEDVAKWERDETKKWYNPENLAHAGSGFLIDVLAGPNVSAGRTKTLTNNGKQITKKMSKKETQMATDQIMSRMPEAKGEAQGFMREFIENQIKGGNFNPSTREAFEHAKNKFLQQTDEQGQKLIKANDEKAELELFDYFKNQDMEDFRTEQLQNNQIGSEANQILQGMSGSQDAINRIVNKALEKQDGKVRPNAPNGRWGSDYTNGRNLTSNDTLAPFGGVNNTWDETGRMRDLDEVFNNPSQNQAVLDNEWERMFKNKEVQDSMNKRNQNIEENMTPESMQNYAQQLQNAVRGMTTKQQGLELGIPFTRFQKEILSPKGMDTLSKVPNALSHILTLGGSYALKKGTDRLAKKSTGIGSKVLSKVSRTWGVPQEIVREVNRLTGERSFAQNSKNREILNMFKNTSKEERETLTQVLSGFYKNQGAEAPSVNPELAQYYQNTMKDIANIENLPNTMEDYTWYVSSLSKKDRDTLANNVQRAMLEGKVDGKTYNLLKNAGADDFNFHTLSRQFKAPQELKNFISQYGGEKMAKKIDLDSGKALMSRYDDSMEHLQSRRLNEFLEKNGYIEGADETGQNLYTSKTSNDMQKYIENAFKRRNSNDYGAFERGVRGTTNWIKSGLMNTPVLSLGTTSRNIQGGIINNMNEGVGIGDYLKALRYAVDNGQYQMGQRMQGARNGLLSKMGDKITDSVGNRTYNFKNGETDFRTLSELMQRNQVDNGIYGADLNDGYSFLDQRIGKNSLGESANDVFQTLLNPTNTKRWLPYQMGRATTQSAENLVRRPLFFNRLNDSGISNDAAFQAGQDVSRTHFNYDASASLTEFEDRVMKQLFPFYTFQRFNLPYTLESILRNPSRMNRITYAEQELNEREGDRRGEEFFEDYLKRGIHLGDGEYLGGNFNPRNDVREKDNLLRNAAQSANPLIKALYDGTIAPQTGESFQGQDITGNRDPLINQQFGRMLQQYAPPVFDGLGMKEVATKDGTEIRQNAQSKTIATDLSPLLMRLTSLGNAYDKSEEKGDSKLWNTLSGLSTYQSDPEMQQGFAIDKEAKTLEKRLAEIIRDNEVAQRDANGEAMTLEDNSSYNSNKLSDKKIQESWANERKWFEESKTLYDLNYEPTWGKTYDGWQTAKDQFGNVISARPMNDKPKTQAQYAEMQVKVERGLAQGKMDWERFMKYYDGGFPTIEDYNANYQPTR